VRASSRSEAGKRILRSDGSQILDFGREAPAADRRSDDPQTTPLTGVIVGTASYMAPEQIEGSRSMVAPICLLA
jgi:serine/threonine protein kinase